MDKVDRREQRRHQRFKAKEGAYAVLSSRVSKVGQILDISLGGLALTYIANGAPSNVSEMLDILLADNGFYLEKIPFQTITDLEIPNRFPFTTIVMKRHGVRFIELSQFHESKLKEFIEKHTTGEA